MPKIKYKKSIWQWICVWWNWFYSTISKIQITYSKPHWQVRYDQIFLNRSIFIIASVYKIMHLLNDRSILLIKEKLYIFKKIWTKLKSLSSIINAISSLWVKLPYWFIFEALGHLDWLIELAILFFSFFFKNIVSNIFSFILLIW